MAKNNVDLSVCIAAHREGLLAHKTFLSISRALDSLDKKVKHEIIVTADNSDKATIDYLKTQEVLKIHLEKVKYGDLGDSRNHAIDVAKGSVIVIADADDLVSENWLEKSYKAVTKNPDAIYHTEYSINFGAKDVIWRKTNSKSIDEEAIIGVWANRWDSAIAASREMLKNNPYCRNSDGFAPEDWHFNSETLAKGIQHKVVPKTVLFVRRKDISIMTEMSKNHTVPRKNGLVSLERIRTLSEFDNNPISKPSSLQRLGETIVYNVKPFVRVAYRIPVLGKYIESGYKSFLHRKSFDIRSKYPEWLMNEWKEIHSIEQIIFPSDKLLRKIKDYDAEIYELGNRFIQLVKKISADSLDYVIFVPWLRTGGADLLAIRYANTIKKLRPNLNIAVIATRNDENEWSGRLKNVDFIPFGGITEGLSKTHKMLLLERLVVQSGAKSIQIIHSDLGFDFVSLHKTLIQNNNYRVFVNTFLEEYNEEGMAVGYVHTHLPDTYDVISKIFTDNAYIVDKLCNSYGYSHDKFDIHYQPVAEQDRLPEWNVDNAHSEDPLRVLWAGRITKQKRPDLVKQIALELSKRGLDVQIDIYGEFGEDIPSDYFNNVNNLNYLGVFEGAASLPINNYIAYLNTSESDGIPNLLLAMLDSGIPVVSTAVGGIPEVVRNGAGALVQEIDNIEDFVDWLSKLMNNNSTVTRMTENEKAIIASQHSQSLYEDMITKFL